MLFKNKLAVSRSAHLVECKHAIFHRAVVQSFRNDMVVLVKTAESMSTNIDSFFCVLLTIK